MLDIFQQLAAIQQHVGSRDQRDFKAFVEGTTLHVKTRNPGKPWGLLDAVGAVFGGADVERLQLMGCDSCGFDSHVTVSIGHLCER